MVAASPNMILCRALLWGTCSPWLWLQDTWYRSS